MTDLTPAALAEGERPTCKQSLQVQTYADFLTEAARYFSRRPTDGEDSAFWANHSNADTCLRIRDALLATASEAEALRAEVGRLREAVALGRYWTQQRSSYGPDIAAVPGAIKAATDLQRIDALIATPIRGAAAGGSGE